MNETPKFFSKMPAHAWVGVRSELLIQTHRWLQKVFNNCDACGICSTCFSIKNGQHHAITWLSPQGSVYVLTDLEPLFRTISFELQQSHHHIFIIQQADSLTQVCSNSLLKVIEEPPIGYYFIFLVEQLDTLLPTLRSRCAIKNWQQQLPVSTQHNTLSSFFMTLTFQSPHSFLQELEYQKPSEQETMALFDKILFYWISQARQAYLTHDNKKKKEALRMVAILRNYFIKPPMPGSSKLWWRDLFLQMHCASSL